MIKPSKNNPATSTIHPIHRIKLFSLLILKSGRLPRSSTSDAAGHTAENGLFRKSTVGVWQSECEREREVEGVSEKLQGSTMREVWPVHLVVSVLIWDYAIKSEGPRIDSEPLKKSVKAVQPKMQNSEKHEKCR